MAVYVLVLLGSIWLLQHGAQGPLRVAIALAPMLPVVGIMAAVARFITYSDELTRQTMLISLAVAGGITAMFVVTSGFLENAGVALPSMWTIWVVYCLAWGVTSAIVRRFYA